MAQRANGLARAKRTRKHRVALCPKHGRGAIHDQCREDLGQIPGRPCQWKGVEAIEGHLMPDHARMPAGVPPKTGVPGFVGYPRGKSPLLVFDRHANLRHEFGNRKLWAEGRCVPAVGPSEAAIARHARGQGRADIALDRPGVKEYEDPSER